MGDWEKFALQLVLAQFTAVLSELSGSNTAVASDFASTPGDPEAEALTLKLLVAVTAKRLVEPEFV